jgi:nicotinamide phosphoribosyltransferase
MFKPNTLFYTDGYKVGHKRMLAPGTTKLYGTWIPRSIKRAPKGVKKIVSFGQQLTWRWLHDEFQENFFKLPEEQAMKFGSYMSKYLGMPYDAEHFRALHQLGYLPIRVKALPEGIETEPNIAHMTFINTVDGFDWLTLYLETIVSSLAWKPSTSATSALQYRRNLVEWVMKTDPSNAWLINFLAHDFSARGLSPWDSLSSGLGHATSFMGSDSLIVIPGAHYFYDEDENEVAIFSVNASEHSVSTTKIFTVGEQQMLVDWMNEFPEGILSVVSDTFDLWKLITEYLPALKNQIMGRKGKLVIRPDSGDPVDIICGEFEPYRVINKDKINNPYILPEGQKFMFLEESSDGNQRYYTKTKDGYVDYVYQPKHKGVIELLWDIFGGTINDQGYKVLDPHIGAIYGDSITLERQIEIYERLAAKGFAATNIVLGIGSFTYQYNTRDTLGFAAKGAWFENNGQGIEIYKDPITDDGTKKSAKGFVSVHEVLEADPTGKLHHKGYVMKDQCTQEEEKVGLLKVIYEDGKFYNQTTLTQVRSCIEKLSKTS